MSILCLKPNHMSKGGPYARAPWLRSEVMRLDRWLRERKGPKVHQMPHSFCCEDSETDVEVFSSDHLYEGQLPEDKVTGLAWRGLPWAAQFCTSWLDTKSEDQFMT